MCLSAGGTPNARSARPGGTRASSRQASSLPYAGIKRNCLRPVLLFQTGDCLLEAVENGSDVFARVRGRQEQRLELVRVIVDARALHHVLQPDVLRKVAVLSDVAVFVNTF